MKKALILLAVALFATSSHGASIAWNISNIAYDGSKLTSAGSELVVSLFYLGNGGSLASSYTQSDIESLDVVATASGTTAKAANSGTYDLVVGSNANGDVFGLLLAYTSPSDSKTYYNIAATTYTLDGFTDATSSVDKYQLAASAMTYTTADSSSTAVSPGGGWTAVPEPSTAALALAGLALLLKRRKA